MVSKVIRASRSRPSRARRPFRVELLEGRLLLSGDAAPGPAPYDMGLPAWHDLWVDPARGSDSATGADRAHALRSFTAAWGQVPADAPLSTAYRILLAGGDYTDALLTSDGWTSDRRGTYQHPVAIASADGIGAAVLHRGMDFQNDSYLYLVGLRFVTDPGANGGGNVVHVAASDHVLIRDCSLDGSDGTTRLAQETLKVNQVQDIWVEGSDIHGAFWFGLDFVAVEYGHVIGSWVHDTGDDALVLKGGTAQVLVQGNDVYDGGVTGITAGQGSGFEFMVAPWVHYEAYDLKIVDNVVHDIRNAGLAVRGGYNILMADNTLYRVGLDQAGGSGLVLVSHGSRSLDNPADAPIARAYHDSGGWGPTATGDGSDPGEYIPNKHVFIYDNVIFNPDGVRTLYTQFDVADPVTPPAGWNIPGPSSATDDLEIRGNVIWNGPAGLDLGINDPALAAQVARDNAINAIRPDLVDPSRGRYDPVAGGRVASIVGLAIPAFPGGDRPSSPLPPVGNLSNAVALDASGRSRASASPPGAFDPAATTAPPVVPLARMLQVACGIIQEAPSVAGLVASTYQRLLGRAPTGAEASTWLGLLGRATITEEMLSATLIGSAEYVRRVGPGGDRAWVAAAFREVLGRAPTAPEASNWLALIGRNAERSMIVWQVESGAEARSAAVSSLYARLLGRAPRADELGAFLALLTASRGERRLVAACLVASAEYYALHGARFDAWSVAARATLSAYGGA